MKIKGLPFFSGCATGMVLVILLLVLVVVLGRTAIQEVLASVAEGKLKAPPFSVDADVDYGWTLKGYTDDVPLDMASLQGKPVFLTFWSPKCVSCLAELNALQGLYEQSIGMVEFITVVTKDLDEVDEVIEKWGISFPVYTVEGERPAMFTPNTTPAAYILSADGKVVFQHFGAVDWSDEATLLYLERLSMQSSMESLEPADQE